MVSSWLAKTSTIALCALALTGATCARHLPQDVYEVADVEQLHFDQLGNLVWDTEQQITQQAKDAFNGFRAAADQSVGNVLHQGKVAAEKIGSRIEADSEALLEQLDLTAQDAKQKSKLLRDRIHRLGKDVLRESSMVLNGVQYQRLVHPAFPQYALRVAKESQTKSCDPDVDSYTGYLDIGQDKHLWFAFFESRSRKLAADKSQEPIVMWLNGGPGCSSSTGWLMEGVGPCTIDKNGTATKYNEHSWTNKASVFFLDQPVNVGFSYSESGDVNNTPDGADDVYAFLSMFFAKFQEYADAPFSIAAESYGGRYAPLIASKIHSENKKRVQEARVHGLDAPKTINLSTIMLGNGLTDPKVQFAAVYDYACNSEYAIFKPDSPQCQTLQTKGQTCASLIDSCYKYDNRLTCTPAGLYCWSSLYSDAQNSGRNLYDVRKSCDRAPDKDGQLCYRDELYVEKYMNIPEVKKSFGVPESVKFEACNMNVNQAFLFNGDGMHNSAAVLPELIADGIRLLVYAGEADFMCNYIGNVGEQAWALSLEHDYQKELNDAKTVNWKVGGKNAGSVRQAGHGAGNVTLVRVADAGHMVPYDQPAAAQAMVEAWLANKAIA
jgi:cathepsin A (carboxypeptidase C)